MLQSRPMATLWITYSWADNSGHDVDFIAQELVAEGIGIKLDRWNIEAGKRLWDQVASFITDTHQSDAWMIYATANSLSSEACREELAYALNRALGERGDRFPIIALFPSTVEDNLIPASIRVRLHVSLSDPDWKERIKAAAEGRAPNVGLPAVDAYECRVHHPDPLAAAAGYVAVVEMRPRAGTWFRFFAAVPANEQDEVQMALRSGPRYRVPGLAAAIIGCSGLSPDGQWHGESHQEEASPTRSYYAYVKKFPSRLAFGVSGGQPQYALHFPR